MKTPSRDLHTAKVKSKTWILLREEKKKHRSTSLGRVIEKLLEEHRECRSETEETMRNKVDRRSHRVWPI